MHCFLILSAPEDPGPSSAGPSSAGPSSAGQSSAGQSSAGQSSAGGQGGAKCRFHSVCHLHLKVHCVMLL